MKDNPFDFENPKGYTMSDWECFWLDIERAWAEQFKFDNYYGEPCDCGSSTCDECNPDWPEFEEE